MDVDYTQLISFIAAVIGFLYALIRLISIMSQNAQQQNSHNQTQQTALLNVISQPLSDLKNSFDRLIEEFKKNQPPC